MKEAVVTGSAAAASCLALGALVFVWRMSFWNALALSVVGLLSNTICFAVTVETRPRLAILFLLSLIALFIFVVLCLKTAIRQENRLSSRLLRR